MYLINLSHINIMPQTSNAPRHPRASYGAGQVQLFSFLFKGFLVTISPILGLGLLRIIFFVFTNPKYFFFSWLLILAIGLVAEFFTDTWRPSSQFSTRTNQPAQPNSGGQAPNIQNTGNEEDGTVTTNKSPTVLFKSQAAIASHTMADKIAAAAADSKVFEKNSGVDVDIDNVSSEESTSPLVQVEACVKIGSRSRNGSPVPRSRSSSVTKGYGKPILLRMDYKLESRSSPKNATETNSMQSSTCPVTETENANQVSFDVSKKDLKKRSPIHSIVPSNIHNSEKKKTIPYSEENLIDHLHFSSMIHVDGENNFTEQVKVKDQIQSKSKVDVETASKEWGILMYQNSENENVHVELEVGPREDAKSK
ncbi:unnamed protein product [Orchesella dallaii]|uniref:Uncharacterized protein n=1 Tax=Orchesella dallaii TaxID=48710 RepID=A0ABP1Q533_9HEXA